MYRILNRIESDRIGPSETGPIGLNRKQQKIGLNRKHSLEIDTKKWIRIGPIGLNRAEWIESNFSGLKLPMLGGNIEIKSE